MGNSPSSPLEGVSGDADYARLRAEASHHAQLRNKYFEQSQQAYKMRDGEAAKQFSLLGKAEAKMMEKANKRASMVIFEANNAKCPADTLDLHGLYVKEALAVTRERIQTAKRKGEDHLIVIVGAGNHSVDGIQKLKPAIEQLVREERLTVNTDPSNKGCLYVNLHGDGTWDGSSIRSFFRGLKGMLSKFFSSLR